MKKSFAAIFFLLSCYYNANADHITGGEMYYTFSGTSGGMNQYSGTLKLFMRCNSGRQFNNPTIISVFDKATNARITNLSVSLSRTDNIRLSNGDPCITNPPEVCYDVGYFNFTVSLPPSSAGYILSSQVNYRINGINNLSGSQVGALYTADIPGTSPVSNGPVNNSANFIGTDLVIVCAGNHFSYSFAATDADGDQLKYAFCSAYQSEGSAGGGGPTGGVPTQPPPYQSVPYGPAYNGSVPLGSNVQIDPNTGLITGIAPSSGIYVVTVCVSEYRNGLLIATQRKDLQINIAPCQIAAAILEPEYLLCRNTRTLTLSNISTSPLISSTLWQIVNSAGVTVFTSPVVVPDYTFTDTGIYTIRLSINKGQACSDSTSSIVRVYPGLATNYSYSGICFSKPTIFTNSSTTIYGVINSWSWDFGETGAPVGTANQPNAVYTYLAMGPKNATLITGTTKGCRDTITKVISIVDRPPLTLSFRDTLICIPDKVQLNASGNGNFSWTPSTNIINFNTPNPTVSPVKSMKYFVDLDDNGCRNRDSVLVRVTDRVTVQAMNDTVICSSDTIQLKASSDGLRFYWTPALQLINPNLSNPFAVTSNNTVYEVTATIGSCSARDQVAVSAIPYPSANAGKDTVICFNTYAQLHGSTNGLSVRWAPAISLNNPNVINAVAKPPVSTAFVLYAYDNKGCPKPGIDTVLVTVLNDIKAFAGSDTSVVAGQPLQLNASGGSAYAWTPAGNLSNPSISNPVATFGESVELVNYKVLVAEQGCVDSAFISVKIFKTGPSVFVPTAFTPNHDGKNDLLRPVAVGISQINDFRIFNRWGQLVYSTSINGSGWDGTINGSVQPSGTFVWQVKAVDYNGKAYSQKGTVVLIR